jgi:hypothetical protein
MTTDRFLAPHGGPVTVIDDVDLHAMLRLARDNFRQAGLGNVETTPADAAALTIRRRQLRPAVQRLPA